MILRIWGIQGYFNSIIFYSDFISTVSLILDISWIYLLLFKDLLKLSGQNELIFTVSTLQSHYNLSTYIHVIRYLRLARVLTWIKLFREYHKKQFYKKAQRKESSESEKLNFTPSLTSNSEFLKKEKTFKKFYKKYKGNQSTTFVNKKELNKFTGIGDFLGAQSQEDCQVNQKKKLKSILKNLTYKRNQKAKHRLTSMEIGFRLFSINSERLFLVVIIIVIITPLFRISTYNQINSRSDPRLEVIRKVAEVEGNNSDSMSEIIDNYAVYLQTTRLKKRKLMYLRIGRFTEGGSMEEQLEQRQYEVVFETGDLDEVFTRRKYTFLVSSKFENLEVANLGSSFVFACIDISYEENLNAIFGVFRTVFVLVFLSIILELFRNDTSTLLINPINFMKKLISLIKKDPVHANEMIDYHILTDTLFVGG